MLLQAWILMTWPGAVLAVRLGREMPSMSARPSSLAKGGAGWAGRVDGMKQQEGRTRALERGRSRARCSCALVTALLLGLGPALVPLLVFALVPPLVFGVVLVLVPPRTGTSSITCSSSCSSSCSSNCSSSCFSTCSSFCLSTCSSFFSSLCSISFSSFFYSSYSSTSASSSPLGWSHDHPKTWQCCHPTNKHMSTVHFMPIRPLPELQRHKPDADAST